MRHVLVVLCLSVSQAMGTDALGWRGTDGSGVFPDATPPTAWSKTNGAVWRVALDKWSNASPLILGDRLVVCAEPAAVMCLKLADGSLLWQAEQMDTDIADAETAAKIKAARSELEKLDPLRRKAEQALSKAREAAKKTPEDEALKAQVTEAEKALAEAVKACEPYAAYRLPSTHEVNGYSTPTPVSDGKSVFVLTGLGTLAAYTPDGKRLWARMAGKPNPGWGHSTSPRFHAGALFVHLGNRLLCLDPATGQEKWAAEAGSGWGPMGFADVGTNRLVLTPGGDWFTTAGVKTASKVQPFPWNGPIVVDGVSYKIDENGGSAVAVNPDGTAKELWKVEVPKARYYATAIVHGGLVYNVAQNGTLVVLDCKDGATVYTQKLDLGGGTVYPSPFLANGLIYASSDNGRTVVFKAGRAFEQVAVNSLDGFRSCPVPHGKRIYVRTLKDVVCLE